MLGGMGVSICGVCTYAAVPGRQIFASNGECMDYDPSPGAGNNVKVHPCHIDANQKWYFEGELLKTDYNDLCLDYNMGNGEVYMHPCHHGANQHWYFDGELLKNRYDNKCLDFQPDSKNIYMGNCPGSNTQHFTWSQAVHGGQQIRSDNNGKCMRVEADGNVKIGDCDVSMANRFYWDGEMIKSEKTGQCLDYHVSVGNIQMYDCHGGSNQRFYWDSKYIKSRHDNQCMDLQHGQGNVYMANCPDAPSQKWRDVDVAKPLPAGRLTDMMYGLCLDKNQENNNVYAAGCHDGNNQKWYFDGELLKNLEDGNCLDENGEGTED
ncbi:unnamed protein product [Durusdinium trenchii]|uniref:Ricin B lectin domain-containing protein n=1 Tax=Durusdinium trenchii TaxID=1381693 RepID=A0ABP0QZQ3_9DINO